MDGNNMETGRDKFVRYRQSIREYSEQGSEISRSPSDLEDLLGDDPSVDVSSIRETSRILVRGARYTVFTLVWDS